MSATDRAQQSGEQAGILAERMAAWLSGGDIQSPAGAFCAWREEDGELAFEYPEITGYALTWLASLADFGPAERRAGERAALWLLERLQTGRVAAHEGFDGGAIYNFDLGMISAGLISFGRRVDDRRFIGRGEEVARRLGQIFLDAETPPALDPSGPASGRPPTWSNTDSPHLAKCVQAMLLAEQWDAAERLIDHAAGFQDTAGYFLTQPRNDLVMLHPCLYVVEAMWMWGTARGDDAALARARSATEWVWLHQLPEGGLPRLVNLAKGEDLGPEQFDVTSQAVRAAVLVGAEVDGFERAVARLCAVARPVGDGAALPYQLPPADRHLNAWVTMFGAQALALVAQGAETSLEWHEIV